MKKIKTAKDVKGIKRGDQFVIDIFPEDPADKAYEDMEKLLAKRDEIMAAVNAEISPPDKKDPVKPGTPAPKKVWSSDDLVKDMKAEAKSRGLKGYSKMKEAELIKLLNE